MKITHLLIIIGLFVNLAIPAKAQEGSTLVVISTKYGNIKLKLYDSTPLHRDNSIKLAKEGYFDSTLFHRCIKNFVIQGGDPDSRRANPGDTLGNGGPGYDIPSEINPALWHKRGALGAARENDDINPLRNSSGSQFYIVVGKIVTDARLDSLEIKYNKKFTPEQREYYKTIGGTPHLDGRYTVFGEVLEGMYVVDIISKLNTDGNDRPLQNISLVIRLIP
jgi:peptidyl-prolyl cis-trans isomerase B (cyclophilin B)